MIEDLNSISYPEGIARANPELNVRAKPGKFIYDRPFLLQFMAVCAERPGVLLDIIDNRFAPHPPMARDKPTIPGEFPMINSTPPRKIAKLTPLRDGPTPDTVHDPTMSSSRKGPTTRTSSQDEPRQKRTRTKRGGKRNTNNDHSVDVPTDQVAGGQVVNSGVNEGISKDIRELFSIRNVNKSEAYFIKLPSDLHYRLVREMVSKAIGSTEDDGKLVADAFARAVKKRLCSATDFEKGFLPVAERLDNVVVGSPKALRIMATMVKGAGLDKDERRLTRIVQKSTNKNKLLELLV